MEAWLVLARALPAPRRPRSQPASRRRTARRIVVSRVVMGQVWRHRVFLQTFREGRARDGICGNSYFIASADVLYRVWKPPESTMSLHEQCGDGGHGGAAALAQVLGSCSAWQVGEER